MLRLELKKSGSSSNTGNLCTLKQYMDGSTLKLVPDLQLLKGAKISRTIKV